MSFPILYAWTAVRSGYRITITHSTGKIANITGIGAIDGKILATKKGGAVFELSLTEPDK